MEKPQDVTGVQRLIGLVKYLSKFLSNLSQICEPIRRLTHKDVEHVQQNKTKPSEKSKKQLPRHQYYNILTLPSTQKDVEMLHHKELDLNARRASYSICKPRTYEC